MTNLNNTVLYLRLSRDDGNSAESESISNQRDFLIDYAEKNNLNVVEILTDDGYSGTNFDRPGFKRLIKLIEDKSIDTIITKDLSRLGRDYIQTGYYLEQYFPLHKIRYIAVNDYIDTAIQSGNSDMTPFRAVFNDMYAKDISKKVRTALDTKKRQGKFVGAYAPYGYKKDITDKNHLVIDEGPADVVRQIFKDFLRGESVIGIAHKLTENKVPTPSEYKKLTATQKYFKGVWSDTMVKNILSNPTYIGNLTQNRSRKISYKVNKKVRLPEAEWITVEGTHEAIISKDDFEAAGELLSKRSYNKRRRAGSKHLLSGLVFCKDCGGGMTFVRESPTRTYLVCSRWRKNAKLGICTSHSIREDYVENIVKEKLRELASAINMSEILTEAGVFFNGRADNEKLKRILEKNIEKCKATLLSLYKDKVNGIVAASDYQELSESLKEERKVYESRLSELNNEESKCNTEKDIVESLGRIIKFEKTDRTTLLLLIDKIYVGKEKEIEILFKFDNPTKNKEIY